MQILIHCFILQILCRHFQGFDCFLELLYGHSHLLRRLFNVYDTISDQISKGADFARYARFSCSLFG